MKNSIYLYGSVILSMIIWSASFIFTKIAIESFQPITLISLRLLIASALLLIITLSTRKLQKIEYKDFKWFILLAFFEPFLYFLGETYGLTLVKSTLASVIVSTIPLFAPLLAFIVLRERISRANIIGIIISITGVYIMIHERETNTAVNPWGVTLLFIAVFAGICYSIILRKIPLKYTAINIVFYQSIIGLLFFIPTFFIVDFHKVQQLHVSTKSLVALFLLAVFASVVAFILFAGSIRNLGVTKTNAFVNLIPVFTALLSWIILDEILTLQKGIGIIIVVFGLFISQWRKRKYQNTILKPHK